MISFTVVLVCGMIYYIVTSSMATTAPIAAGKQGQFYPYSSIIPVNKSNPSNP